MFIGCVYIYIVLCVYIYTCILKYILIYLYTCTCTVYNIMATNRNQIDHVDLAGLEENSNCGSVDDGRCSPRTGHQAAERTCRVKHGSLWGCDSRKNDLWGCPKIGYTLKLLFFFLARKTMWISSGWNAVPYFQVPNPIVDSASYVSNACRIK